VYKILIVDLYHKKGRKFIFYPLLGIMLSMSLLLISSPSLYAQTLFKSLFSNSGQTLIPYTNSKYGVSLSYPSNWHVSKQSNGNVAVMLCTLPQSQCSPSSPGITIYREYPDPSISYYTSADTPINSIVNGYIAFIKSSKHDRTLVSSETHPENDPQSASMVIQDPSMIHHIYMLKYGSGYGGALYIYRYSDSNFQSLGPNEAKILGSTKISPLVITQPQPNNGPHTQPNGPCSNMQTQAGFQNCMKIQENIEKIKTCTERVIIGNMNPSGVRHWDAYCGQYD